MLTLEYRIVLFVIDPDKPGSAESMYSISNKIHLRQYKRIINIKGKEKVEEGAIKGQCKYMIMFKLLAKAMSNTDIIHLGREGKRPIWLIKTEAGFKDISRKWSKLSRLL